MRGFPERVLQRGGPTQIWAALGQAPPSCISYLSQDSEKVPDRRTLKGLFSHISTIQVIIVRKTGSQELEVAGHTVSPTVRKQMFTFSRSVKPLHPLSPLASPGSGFLNKSFVEIENTHNIKNTLKLYNSIIF